MGWVSRVGIVGIACWVTACGAGAADDTDTGAGALSSAASGIKQGVYASSVDGQHMVLTVRKVIGGRPERYDLFVDDGAEKGQILDIVPDVGGDPAKVGYSRSVTKDCKLTLFARENDTIELKQGGSSCQSAGLGANAAPEGTYALMAAGPPPPRKRNWVGTYEGSDGKTKMVVHSQTQPASSNATYTFSYDLSTTDSDGKHFELTAKTATVFEDTGADSPTGLGDDAAATSAGSSCDISFRWDLTELDVSTSEGPAASCPSDVPSLFASLHETSATSDQPHDGTDGESFCNESGGGHPGCAN